jgi:thioredoxin-dependent peroxiredoxin
MNQLTEGKKAPNWTCTDETGRTHSHLGYTGKKLALYFYPKDNTPGCINQACNLRDNYSLLQKHGITILGISPDSATSHTKFIAKRQLPFPLLADVEKKMINAFGVWGPKKFMGRSYDGLHRTTFLIDEEGTLVKVIEKPKTKDHAREILEGFQINF